MLGNSTLTIVDHVNELHRQTQVEGDLDASAYTILTSMRIGHRW